MALYYAAIHRVHVPRLRGLTERGEEKLGRKSTPASNPPVGSWVLDFDSRLRGRLEATISNDRFRLGIPILSHGMEIDEKRRGKGSGPKGSSFSPG